MPRAKSTGRKKWSRALSEDDKNRLTRELMEDSSRDGEQEDVTYFTGGKS